MGVSSIQQPNNYQDVVELPSLHISLDSPYPAKSLNEVTFLNAVPLFLQTRVTYVLFSAQVFSWTITDTSSGTVTFTLMLSACSLAYLMSATPSFDAYCIAFVGHAIAFACAYGITLFDRKRAYLALRLPQHAATWLFCIRIPLE